MPALRAIENTGHLIDPVAHNLLCQPHIESNYEIVEISVKHCIENLLDWR